MMLKFKMITLLSTLESDLIKKKRNQKAIKINYSNLYQIKHNVNLDNSNRIYALITFVLSYLKIIFYSYSFFQKYAYICD